MKTIHVKEIIENVKEMCIEANHYLTDDMKQALKQSEKKEKSHKIVRLKSLCLL